MFVMAIVLAIGNLLAGCDPDCPRVAALDVQAWGTSEWISVVNAPVADEAAKKRQRAADGTSVFWCDVANRKAVKSAKWMTTSLGVGYPFLNGRPVGREILRPGYTHYAKTKYAFTYDVTALLKKSAGDVNRFAAEVSAGWWRDKIVNYKGQKSAFRGVVEFTYEDGTTERIGTKASEWKGAVAGPVMHAGIFDGEEYDARQTNAARSPGKFVSAGCERNDEFKGEILPTAGAEIVLRWDLAIRRGPYTVKPGETLVVDFGQNCAAVPCFEFGAKRGTVLTVLPGEMLNDADKGQRGSDGPKGSVYRENLRMPNDGMRVVYTFSGVDDVYIPAYTFFGYRYLSITATDTVEIKGVASVPVSSVTQEMELGSLETGDPTLNRFIQNVLWGQRSNYLSVSTDCPQRNERLGWSADTQVFCEAGSYNADTRSFFRKFTRDLRDSRCKDGGYPSVAPWGQYGNETFNLGWADVGVIVPYRIWQMFGDRQIVEENYEAMAKFVRKLDETKYDFEGKLGYIYADWLSFEKFETCGNRFGAWTDYSKKGLPAWKDDPDAKNYRRFLAACYWRYDAGMLAEMAEALGKSADAAWFRASAARALAYIREKFVEADGLLLKPMRELQTACVFAIRFGVVEGAAKAQTLALLKKSIAEHDGCLQTGFLGASFIMDVLADCGEHETAYNLLFNHKCPGWLYSVDQGATTVWERWNSYTKKDGFGPVGMNSFNHYAYGAVLGWIYRTAAGIAVDPAKPGFRNIVMKPVPDRRLGFVKAEYKSAAGLVKSAWKYDGDTWIWDFTVPEGATASVTLPGETVAKTYEAGTYHIEK